MPCLFWINKILLDIQNRFFFSTGLLLNYGWYFFPIKTRMKKERCCITDCEYYNNLLLRFVCLSVSLCLVNINKKGTYQVTIAWLPLLYTEIFLPSFVYSFTQRSISFCPDIQMSRTNYCTVRKNWVISTHLNQYQTEAVVEEWIIYPTTGCPVVTRCLVIC